LTILVKSNGSRKKKWAREESNLRLPPCEEGTRFWSGTGCPQNEAVGNWDPRTERFGDQYLSGELVARAAAVDLPNDPRPLHKVWRHLGDGPELGRKLL